MEGTRFDDVARTLVATGTRRTVLGSLAALPVAGWVLRRDALAQPLSGTKFDLTCRQSGAGFFCIDSVQDISSCGPNRRGCRCARTRRNSRPVCVEQPEGDCPGRRQACRRNSQCPRRHVCIRVSTCCPNNPGRGVCARRCAE